MAVNVEWLLPGCTPTELAAAAKRSKGSILRAGFYLRVKGNRVRIRGESFGRYVQPPVLRGTYAAEGRDTRLNGRITWAANLVFVVIFSVLAIFFAIFTVAIGTDEGFTNIGFVTCIVATLIFTTLVIALIVSDRAARPVDIENLRNRTYGICGLSPWLHSLDPDEDEPWT